MTRIILVLLLILSAIPLNAFVHCENGQLVNSEGEIVLNRGMGLGGWLVPEGYMLHFPGYGSPTSIRAQIVDVMGESGAQDFYELYQANYVTRADMIELGAWGFDHIRLPFHYNQISPFMGQIDQSGLDLIDTVLAWSEAADMLVVLDMHCAPGGQNHGNISDSDGTARLWLADSNKAHAIEIWRILAERYADEERIAGYDLINEPVLPEGVPTSALRSLYMNITTAIRQEDPNHTLFIEGNWYASDFSGLDPPWDANMAYSFHKYWSYNTQGSIQSYINLRNAYGTPLWMSESGENSNAWFNGAIELFENNNIGWCWWTHKKYETVTSVYSAMIPESMDPVFDYWSGSGPKPSEAVATAALMEYANNLRTENCIVRPGVIPSMFDPEYALINKPWKNLTIPGIINTADYDLGTQGVAYADADWEKYHWDGNYPWNRGYQYRNDGVDLEIGSSGIPNVGWTEAGEWMKYTFNSDYSGIYHINFEFAGNAVTNPVNLYLDDVLLASVPQSPGTAGWQIFEEVTINDLEISYGEHELRLDILQSGANMRNMEFILDSVHIDPQNPDLFHLGNNYPNPFNGSTKIPLHSLTSEAVQLSIIDLSGRTIKSYVIPEHIDYTEIVWDGQDQDGLPVSAGVYISRAISGSLEQAKKMIYLP